MSTRIAIAAGLLLTALGFSVPDGADAQCIGWVCADVHVHVGPPRHRVVVVQPAPPPPRVVYVQPQEPPPQVVIVQAPPRYQLAPQQQQPAYNGEVGIHGHVGTFLSDRIRIGGATGALRFRPNPRYALDLGVGAYVGTDYNGLDRLEVPGTADLLVFFNPDSRFQAYGLAGFGVSWAVAEGTNSFTGQFQQREFIYVGGQVGLGLEWRIGPHIAVNADVRGFVRHRVNDDGVPEFIDPDTGETTNTSVGGMGTLGATFYF